MKRATLVLLVIVACAGSAWAKDIVGYRCKVAAADMQQASQWMGRAYEIPARVPQELLLHHYSYADTLVALALMGEGASLNQVLDLRRYGGGEGWRQVARGVHVDPRSLPPAIRELLGFGTNGPPPPALHFLPDVHPGLARQLKVNAFSPTVPSPSLVNEFALDDDEVRDIRRALADPFGVPKNLLLQPAGRGLVVGDWVLAGVLAYLKPLPIESVLASRTENGLPWSEVVLALGLRPDVLTQGPLSGIYPVMTGVAPNTILCARRRRHFPRTLPLRDDLDHLTGGERRALLPILWSAFRATPSEIGLLLHSKLDMGGYGIALTLARISSLSVSNLLELHHKLSWSDIIRSYAIDMTGQQAVLAAIAARERKPH